MKETYRAYNSRDELDRVFRVGLWFQGRISSDFLSSSFHQGFSYRSGARGLCYSKKTAKICQLDPLYTRT